MAAGLIGDDLLGNSSRRSWTGATSFREILEPQPGVFSRSGRRQGDDEQELKWAAIERLPTFARMRKGVLGLVNREDGSVVHGEVDVAKLGVSARRQLMDSILRAVENDNEKFLTRLRNRTDRVGIEIPKIEVRFEHLSVEGDVYVGSRALPTLLNVTLNAIESILVLLRLAPSKKRKIHILQGVSGIVKPSRMTLLLGPPGAGKTTLLTALAGKLDKDLRVNGKVTYCGHEMHEFVPQRTCAYIGQHDLHYGEMTVRETLDFSGRCMGVGARYEMLAELSRREKEAGIKPDLDIDAFMKATALTGQKTNLITDYVLKILGLDICADIMVGDDMRRGISGGEKKRVTTGEMLVGPAKAFFMDEISNGLDSSTTFQIIKFMRQMVHTMDVTMVTSLLQPAPETFNLFDDIILLSEGRIVYQGPRDTAVVFFEYMGFRCPERKATADFLQEVTSKKDQEQYWFRKEVPYAFISVPDFVQGFKSFHVGQQIGDELGIPYDRSRTHPGALARTKYGISNMELLKACFSREIVLLKRSAFIYVFKTTQLTIMSLIGMSVFLRTEMHVGTVRDGQKYFGALFFCLVTVMFNGVAELTLTIFRLPVFYKQRDFHFYPAWAFGLPIVITRIPVSLLESTIWVILTYYTIGFAPSASRFFKQYLALFNIHQMALSLFRFIAAVGRTPVAANTQGTFVLLAVFLLGGFIIAKDDILPWMQWAFYVSPMMYGQNALVINEFLDERWSAPNVDPRFTEATVGKVLLASRSFFTTEYWYWICIGALVGFSILFNLLFVAALTYMNPPRDSKSIVADESDEKAPKDSDKEQRNDMRRGMVLPFKPLSLAFNHVNYYVDMPAEMKTRGIEDERLQLLRDVSGAFRPGILTALVGVSGAGKTTLMDVLAGRKTGGYTDGTISISGYPKRQETFARVSGYCEQNDIHSPNVTVYESLLYSAWLRLSSDVTIKTRKMFVEEVLDLIELRPLRDALVGLPGVNGLSTEQRKRLTIAVELVASPSIVFMDEPTSGLDARAAAIVMRTVRNTVDTGRTVVCTIHQPSIDIFEAFDELLLMKRGGQVVYAGPLGHFSHKLVEYFEAIPGVPKIQDGHNPATWMLEVSSPSVEAQLDIDFAEIYANSNLYKRNQEIIKNLSTPDPNTSDLHFPTTYSQPFSTQFYACFWKQHWSYWRNAEYNGIRFAMTIVIGLLFGTLFWDKGQKTSKEQDLMNFLGAMYSAIFFLGALNATTVQGVVAVERTVFYRERAAGMYSELPYAFSQVVIELIYTAVQSAVYTILLFSMMNFEWQITKVLWFFFLIYMSFVAFTLYGMLMVALTPNLQIAAVCMGFFLSFWNLFAGFLLPRHQIPIWWRWYYWGNPVSWTLYGLVTSQVADKDSALTIPGVLFPVSVRTFLKAYLGFEYSFLPEVAAAHVGFVLLFFFVFAYGIKFLNYQRR